MLTFRQTRSLARLVLVWFALFVVAATAGPIVNPRPLELICSGDGAVKLQVQDSDGVPATMGIGMDCPFCQLTAAPPPSASLPQMPPLPMTAAVDVRGSPRRAAIALPPLPPRGPPSRLSFV